MFAAFLGAFSVAALKEIPTWISAMAAAASAGISAIAVYLVAGTLKATISTLELTREMAAAQSEAYSIEFRPQVLVDEVKILSVTPAGDGMAMVSLRFSFRNFGKMAALRVFGQVIAGDAPVDEPIDMDKYTSFWGVSHFRKSTLRPEGTFDERVVVRCDVKDGLQKIISPQLHYDDERGHRHFDVEKAYYFLSHKDDSFSIKEIGLFDITPHAGFNESDMDEAT